MARKSDHTEATKAEVIKRLGKGEAGSAIARDLKVNANYVYRMKKTLKDGIKLTEKGKQKLAKTQPIEVIAPIVESTPAPLATDAIDAEITTRENEIQTLKTARAMIVK